jgi:hypothetical protein
LVTFGVGMAQNGVYTLRKNGVNLSSSYNLGNSPDQVVASVSTIISITSGDTLEITNISGASRNIASAGTAGTDSIISYMTIVKL